MDKNKFNSEVQTLKKFLEIYCKSHHENIKEHHISLDYKDETFNHTLHLCEQCLTTINYSFEKLQDCQHEIKPRCRTCPTPCYDKTEWKKLAKIMKYSGLQLGLTKIKSKIKSFFK